MKSSWNISGFVKQLEETKVEDALNVIGQMGVTWASENLRRNKSVITSNLINSIAYSTSTIQSSPKTESPLENAERKSLKIGSNAVYAARVEFGFVGKDSLGRNYNQSPKPYLRSILTEKRNEILKIFQAAING